MSRARKTSRTTLAKHLRNLAAFVDENSKDAPELMTELAGWFNTKMDELYQADTFGTEGQVDPRGDHRE